MAAGLVYHNIVTAPSGGSFTFAGWAPNTSSADANLLPVAMGINNAGAPWDFGSGTGGSATQRMLIDTSQLGADPTKQQDAAATGADPGIPALARRTATPANIAGTEGDYEWLQVFNGRLWAHSIAVGDIAHASADGSGSAPVKQGARATTSLAALTLAADANRVNLHAGIDGVQITRPHCNLEDLLSAVVTCTSGANTSGIAAQGAGVKIYITAVLISNIGGAAAGNLSVTDGTGGTEKINVPFSTVGAVENLPIPVGFSANIAVFVDPSGSDTVKVTLIGFKSKI